jgi:hypothetical protein
MLLAIARIPDDDPEARRRAAAAAELALADLNRRLAGILPRVLLAAVPEEQGARLAEALGALGFGVLTCNVAVVPSDEDRVVAQRVDLAPDTLVVTDAQGNVHRCPRGAIRLVQRGARHHRAEARVTTTVRKLAPVKALLTGGLILTSKEQKTSTRVTETSEPFLLVERADAEPDLILYERRIDYRHMGAQMDPSSRANLDRLWAWLAQMAPPGAIDERVAQPGFVSGLPATTADPVDLALFLVSLARR